MRTEMVTEKGLILIERTAN